jgi:DNA transposition AAA+ family ATPase
MEEKKEVVVNEELYGRFFNLVGASDEGKRISQSKAAQAIGYSSGVISAYKSRAYNGNVKALEEKIEAWLKREARRVSRIEVPTVETSVIAQIRKAIALAHDEADIAVIVGEAGTGKTTAIRQYETESHSAFVVEVDPAFSKTVLIAEIARAIGVDSKGSSTVVISRIVEALRGRDAVLIIDEADYLSDACLELLRRVVNDKAETGVVLVGLPRLEYKLRNLRNDHEQLTSRVGVFLKLEKMKKVDAIKILSKVWQSLSAETIDAFVLTAAGSVRSLVKLMGRVHQTLVLSNIEKPDTEVISAVGELLMK